MMLRILVANLTGSRCGRCAGAGLPMFTDDSNAATAVTAAAVMTIHYSIHAIKHDDMTANVGIIAHVVRTAFQMHVNFGQWAQRIMICK